MYQTQIEYYERDGFPPYYAGSCLPGYHDGNLPIDVLSGCSGYGSHRGPLGGDPSYGGHLTIVAHLVMLVHLEIVIPLVMKMVMETLLIEIIMDPQDQ